VSIRWITPVLGTAPALEVLRQPGDFVIIDVREMVDKSGNRSETVREKIDQGVQSLRQGHRTIVCCDYGISRSNAVAAGILSLYEGIQFVAAVKRVQRATGELEIKSEPLQAVRRALGENVRERLPGSRRRVMVTGASGFIGKTLLPLLESKFDLLTPARDEIDIEAGSTQLSVFLLEHDADCVIHLANPRVYTSNKAFGITLTMLRNVLDACSSVGAKLIYLSGWEVYSAYSGHLYADEKLPLHAKGPYGDAKYFCENLIGKYRDLTDLQCAILRSGPVYGFGSDRPKFIFNFLEKALAGSLLTTHCYANGHPALDLMHVNDLAQAIALALHEDVTGDFNLGTGVLTNTFKIASDIVQMVGSRSEVKSILLDASTASIAMNNDKARKALGWSPSVPIEEGLKSLIKQRIDHARK